MYIIILSYKKDLSVVEQHLDEHINYLNTNYQSENFIVSGRKSPRTGGVIICKAMSKEYLQTLICKDPFYKYEIADYEIIDFEPTKYAKGFEQFL